MASGKQLNNRSGGGSGSNDVTPIMSPHHQTTTNATSLDNATSQTSYQITSPTTIGNNSSVAVKNRLKSGVGGGVIGGDNSAFSTNFFTNVSIGYNVLLHTFQYLKVQVSVGIKIPPI